MVAALIIYLIYVNITGADTTFSDVFLDTADNITGDTQRVQTTDGTAVVQTSSAEEGVFSPSAFLGVDVMNMDDVIAGELNMPNTNGVLINEVIANSPAQKAGLERGDVIVVLNNQIVKDMDSFREIMADLEPKDRVKVVYIRDGRKTTTYVRLVELPSSIRETTGTVNADNSSDWGVSLSPLTPLLRNSFNVPSGMDGIMILSVEPGGAADAAGLVPGDVITGVDRTDISDIDDFFYTILSDKNTTALLDIYSQGVRRYVPMDSSSIQVAADQTQEREQANLMQKLFSIFTGGSSGDIILTEHTNEEDDYEKPVCKRLEESGERYGEDVVYNE